MARYFNTDDNLENTILREKKTRFRRIHMVYNFYKVEPGNLRVLFQNSHIHVFKNPCYKEKQGNEQKSKFKVEDTFDDVARGWGREEYTRIFRMSRKLDFLSGVMGSQAFILLYNKPGSA